MTTLTHANDASWPPGDNEIVKLEVSKSATKECQGSAFLRKACLASMLTLVAVVALNESALAAPPWRGDEWSDRFNGHDHRPSGYWHHGRHQGRYGWWWVENGVWVWYAKPVYPYPIIREDPVVYVEPVVPPPPAPPKPVVSPPVSAQVWYYCDAAKAYYPYVSSCPAGWRQVPARPAQ